MTWESLNDLTLQPRTEQPRSDLSQIWAVCVDVGITRQELTGKLQKIG